MTGDESLQSFFHAGEFCYTMRMRRRRALALPFALFFTGLMFCLCTVMATEALTNLQLTTLESEKIRQLAAARGVVDRAVYRLNKNNDCFAGNTTLAKAVVQSEEDGLTSRVWVSHDEKYGHIWHVHAQVDGGTGSTFQQATRIVRQAPNVKGVAYAQVPGIEHGDHALDALLVYVNGAWDLIPPVPFAYNDPSGNLHTTSEYSRALPFICADWKGNLIAVNHPLWHHLMVPDPLNPLNLIRPLLVRFMNESMQHTDIWSLFIQMHSLAEASFSLPGDQPAVMRYSKESGEWKALPAVPGYNLLGNGDFQATGNCVNPGMLSQCSSDGKTFYLGLWRSGADFMFSLDLSIANPQKADWKPIPPPPYDLYLPSGEKAPVPASNLAPMLGSVTQDGYGNMYALYGDIRVGQQPRSGIFHWDGAAWHSLPPPPREYYASLGGELVREQGVPSNFCFMRSAPGGELHGMWWNDQGLGQFLKYSGGVWSAIRPPLEGLPNTLDTDGEGRLLVKYARDNEADRMFSIYHGGSTELKPLPNRFFDDTGHEQTAAGNADSSQGIAGGGHVELGGPEFRYFPAAAY